MNAPVDGVRPPPERLLRAGRPLARFIIRRYLRLRVHHVENVPARGGVILAANHIGWADGPLLAICSPRPVHALTKIEMFHGALGGFLRRSGQIPLDRKHVDRAAVRSCIDALESGQAIGIFPEGTRGAGDLARFHRGAAYLALVTGAPIVPVAILGTRDAGGLGGDLPRRGSTVDLHYGEPLQVERSAWPRRREQVEELSLLLRRRMLDTIAAAIAATGQALPGPLPSNDPHSSDDPDTGLVTG